MQSEESHLTQRTKEFALQIVWMFRDYLKRLKCRARKPSILKSYFFRPNFRDARACYFETHWFLVLVATAKADLL